MSYKLFLDDYRHPTQCLNYMYKRIGNKNPVYLREWVIVKTYDEFVDYIKIHGMPELISFDHDLADVHYFGELKNSTDWEDYHLMAEGDREMTGYDCAKWLVDYCETTGKELPEFYVHSMNEVGTENITRYLNNYKKMKENEQEGN